MKARLLFAATLSALLALTARAEALTREQRDALTPDEVITEMKEGNARFRRGERKERNFLAEQKASAKGQFPAAVILSCIDSRTPAEVIMDLGIGETFNARIAGNVVNDDIIGSLEFSCAVSGAKVVLVLGHTACGAIKGAIDHVQLGSLTGLLDKVQPAIAATKYDGEHSSKNYSYVNAVGRKNVELAVADIRKRSALLRDLEAAGKIKIVGAVYDLDTAVVEFLP